MDDPQNIGGIAVAGNIVDKAGGLGELRDRLERGQTGTSNSQEMVPLAKAYFVGENSGDQSNAMVEQDRQSSVFTSAGAILPVYDPNILALIFENSSTLRQCVDAYVTNIDSFGHHYVPFIDLASADADKLIADAMRAERLASLKNGSAAKNIDQLLQANTEPTPSEIAERKKALEIEMRAERAELENFFENCTTDQPFAGPEGLRGLTRQDIEILGYGYWEVLRNQLREIANFNRLEGRTMRLMPMGLDPVQVEIPVRVSALKYETKQVMKRFRLYVQVMENTERLVYFKEFGDPRIVDSQTGKIYANQADADKDYASMTNGEKFRPATEVLQFKITSSRSPYGVPRWIGTLLSVLGNRQAEEVNFLYFENRSVPPLAVLVSGGCLNKQTTKTLEDYISNQIKGKRNFHKILILEAEGPGGDGNTGRMKIELKPLTDAQQKDGLFQAYDERNADKVGQAFRLPRLLRGDVRDFNRSTAEASVDFAEIQVFGPIRQQFDWIINKMILPALGIRYHHFRSNGPTIRDPEQLAKMVEAFVTASILTPGEGRELARGVFNREFEAIKEPWTNQPIAITVAGHNAEANAAADGGGSPGHGGGVMSTPNAAATQAALGVDQSKAAEPSPEERVQLIGSALEKLHGVLLKAEREEYDDMKRDAETIKVPRDLFLTWIHPES